MKKYDHLKIEKKWQKEWAKTKLFEAKNDSDKPKWYSLIEFPYPSGSGLHVGHVRSNTAMDIISRKRRMEGFNVLYPIGWDAFGLPTENYAIKTGKQPALITKENTDNFRQQLQSLGFSFDWSREINTTDPKYYKWTQWIFLQMFKAGLAYKKKMTINWCPKDKIGLANEEVINGCCERCGTPVEKREKEQWMLAITKYADRLDKDLDGVDYLPQIKTQQRNWIGKSEGAEIEFQVDKEKIKVFTTRPDTLFGVTFIAVSPELAKQWLVIGWPAPDDVKEYIEKTLAERLVGGFEEKAKTGMSAGFDAINPANGEKIPVWIVNYVLGDVGTGAIMGVPAHDERDFEFAKKYKISIRRVVADNSDIGNIPEEYKSNPAEYIKIMEAKDFCFTGNGKLLNSGQFDGLSSEEAKKKITEFVGGKMVTTYKLRDWVFSRQRYWGEPIPLVHCEKCGYVPVPEKDLPVELPKVDKYEPTDNGESPLSSISKWVNVKCPQCNGDAKRETDTMPQWAGSSWYYLRYTDTENNKEFASADALKYWLTARPVRDKSPEATGASSERVSNGVDWYNGGMEHTTLHLLYSRFWHKFLFDQGLVPTSEPYQKRTSHGLILAEGGEKMSKSKGNVVNPDELVTTWGADSFRLFEMFMGPFDQPVAWSSENIIGVRRFLEKVWRLQDKIETRDTRQEIREEKSYLISHISNLEVLLNKTIVKVTEDIEGMRFNTSVSAMMVLVNEFEKQEKISQTDFEIFLKLLSPFAPHIVEEIWSELGHSDSIVFEPWPVADMSKMKEENVTVVVQVNGKVRGQVVVGTDASEEEVLTLARQSGSVSKWFSEGEPKKVIYIKNRLINVVF